MALEHRKIGWISWLRTLSMAMIVICHLASASNTSVGIALGQFFNVGVELFFIISGYLFGTRQIQCTYGKWIWKRIKRLVPAYYLFLAILALLHVILGIHQDAKNWIISVLFLQGTGIYVRGAAHLWFLTVMLLCYLLTPVLDALKKRSNNLRPLITFLMITIMVCIGATLFINGRFGRYLSFFALYCLAYILGCKNWTCKTWKTMLVGWGMAILSITVRLIGRQYWDGTVFYNMFIVSVTHAVLAFAIMMTIQYLFRTATCKAVSFFDKVSYEVYLVHCVFIAGPVSLMQTTNSYLLNCVLACAVSFVSAVALHYAAMYLIRK